MKIKIYIHVSFAILIATTLVFTNTSLVAAREGNGAGDKLCPGGTLSTSLPLPPKGMASTRTVTFDEKCDPIFGPVEILPVDQVFIPSQNNISGATLPTISDQGTLGEGVLATSSTWTVRSEQSVWDCCGIMMNDVYASGSWTANGSIIQSYSIGGGYQWKSENVCGPGWYPVNPYHRRTSGGVGYSSTSFRTHSEFGYDGVFDCSGTKYYNTLDNYTTIYANGTGTCNFTKSSRTWLASWKWITSCTR